MGTLRTVLALLVVVAHVAGLDPDARIGMSGGAVMAVNAFFVISGFYMTLILTTKYQG